MLAPRGRLARLAAVLLPITAIGLASAGAGDLDTSFGGGDGLAILNLGRSLSGASGLAIQPDGRIVAGVGIGNDFGVVRLLPDGGLDASFGTNGVVTTDFGGSEEIRAVAIQPDGRIVAVGSSNSAAGRRFAVARYNADGTLDATFDADGKVLTGLPGRSGEATAVALQAVGDAVKIVVAGTALTGGAGTDQDVVVVRYDADGSLDTTFNGTGQVVVLNFGRSEYLASIAIQPDGKIVVGGAGEDVWSGTFDFLLVRFEPTGALDATFGIAAGTGGYAKGGQVTTDFAEALVSPSVTDDVLGGIAIQLDGKIVAGGFTDTGVATFALARYEVDGTLDPTFGVGGLVSTPAGWGTALVLRPDAKILLGGFGGQDRDFVLARYGADGSLDASLGTGGIVTTNLGGFDAIHALALQADQKLVAAGTTAGIVGTQLAVARYLGGDTTPPTIDRLSVTPSSLWPPNHKFVQVTVTAHATDDGADVPCAISGISSSEPMTGPDDATAPDWLTTGPLTASLRAERSNGASGRTYTIVVACVDDAGNAATDEVVVSVSNPRP